MDLVPMNIVFMSRDTKSNKNNLIAKSLIPNNNSRPEWSRDYHTRHWIRDSRVQTRPGSMDLFQSVKILSMTSFGKEVKPWVVKELQAEIRASEQNSSDNSRSL